MTIMRIYADCTAVRGDFSALLDGELTTEERESLEAHLSTCAECLRELDGMKRVDTVYRRLQPVHAPASFENRLRDAQKPSVLRFSRERLPMKRLAPMLAAAAMLLVVGGASILALRQDTPAMQGEQVALESAARDTPVMSAMPAEVAPDAAQKMAADTSAFADAERINAVEGFAGADLRADTATPAAPPALLDADESATAPALVEQPMRLELQAAQPEMAAASPPNAQLLESAEERERVASAAPAVQPVPRLQLDDQLKKESGDVPTDAELERQLSLRSADRHVALEPTPAPSGANASTMVAETAGVSATASAAPEESAGGERKALRVGAQTPQAQAPQPAPAIAQKATPKRVIERKDDAWYEEGYANEAPIDIERTGDLFQSMLKSDLELQRYVSLSDAVVFKYEEKWYRLPGLANTSQSDSAN